MSVSGYVPVSADVHGGQSWSQCEPTHISAATQVLKKGTLALFLTTVQQVFHPLSHLHSPGRYDSIYIYSV